MINADMDNGKKLQKIKMCILKYKSTGTEEVILDDETKVMATKYDNMLKDAPVGDDMLDHTLDLMSILTNTTNKHSALLEKLGMVIKDEKLDNDRKIDMIVDLLI